MRGPLISVPELRESLGRVALFDVRWNLEDPSAGRQRYLSGHVPTAVFVDLDRDLAGVDGPGRHPLPTAAEFAVTLGNLGVSSHTDVVVYDDAGGGVAARMWWMLRAIGHRGSARVLDGGWQAWADSGFETAIDDTQPAAVAYPTPHRGFRGVVDREEVAAAAGSHLLFDARSPERYRGEFEPVDPRAGHIPSAINTPWQANLASDGRLLDAGTIRRRFEALGAERTPVIVSCGSGVNSCHIALAMEIAGLPRPKLYVGSFSDWARTELAVVEGPDPG
ncbi:MAG: sulfurtransferase [Acidimicrobiia bacterium]